MVPQSALVGVMSCHDLSPASGTSRLGRLQQVTLPATTTTIPPTTPYRLSKTAARNIPPTPGLKSPTTILPTRQSLDSDIYSFTLFA